MYHVQGYVKMLILILSNTLLVFFFFFFQAEDCIRDLYVTGVQTCALPIFERLDDGQVGGQPPHGAELVEAQPAQLVVRSEERRVGKECKCWSGLVRLIYRVY